VNRTGLIILQGIGALSLLPYPFVLLANVMSIAAPKQTLFGALPFLLLSIYPLLWIALWVISWLALRSGSVGLAFGLSGVPVLAIVAAFGFYSYSEVSVARFYKSQSEEVRQKMERANPLLWTIYRVGGAHRFPAGPVVPVDQAIREIDANPERVNIAAPPYGTPLNVAVFELAFAYTDSPVAHTPYQQDATRLVRALVAHGAHFNEAEKIDLRAQWKLKRALYDGPINTATENPLVWRILTRKRDGMTLFKLQPDELPLLNQPTKLHGTPLYAAMLEDGPDAITELIKAGGHLSPEEEHDPAASATLQRILSNDSELQNAYSK
jgi:hypothetical protein